MIRLTLFIIVAAVCSFFVTWLAEHNGSIHMVWGDYVIETSILTASVVMVVAVVMMVTCIEILLWVKAAPRRLSRGLREKRRDKGLKSLTEGFAAIAAGDTSQAHKLSKKTKRYLGEIPLSTLLAAQTAQLEGNPEETKKQFKALLKNEETQLIALKGLLMEAHKDGNTDYALELAKKAVALNPNMHWAVKMLIDLYKQTEQWELAQVTLEAAVRRRIIRIEEAKRSSGMLYIARSHLALKKKQRHDALYFAQEANKQLPYFTPIVVQLATLYHETGSDYRAVKLLEGMWKRSPHPSISVLFLEIYKNVDGAKLMKRANKFASIFPDHIESDILTAQAALVAKDMVKARNYLKVALSKGETKKLCQMMAELEKMDSRGDADQIQKWYQREKQASPDSQWVCGNCGHKTDDWDVACYHCHAFDTMEWQEAKVLVVS